MFVKVFKDIKDIKDFKVFKILKDLNLQTLNLKCIMSPSCTT